MHRQRFGRVLLRLAFGVTIFLDVAAVLLAGEFLARTFHVIDRMNGFPRALYLATDLPDLPYRLRPGVRATIGNFTVRVNAFGLRGADVGARPIPGRHRLLVLGDSIVWGAGLDETDTFPVLLEQDLAARGAPPAEVLNAAAAGYNTAAEVAWLREFGLALSPDELILGVSLNDYGPAPVMTPAGVLAGKPVARSRLPWLTNHSELYTLLRWLTTYARGQFWWQKVGQHGEGPQQIMDRALPMLDEAVAKMHKSFYAAPSGPGWDSVRESLVALRDLARARGLPLTVVVFPERYQVGPDADIDPQRVWLALCAELDLRCLDLHPAFAAAASDGTLFQDTQHPNAAGMRVAARATAEFLAPENAR